MSPVAAREKNNMLARATTNVARHLRHASSKSIRASSQRFPSPRAKCGADRNSREANDPKVAMSVQIRPQLSLFCV